MADGLTPAQHKALKERLSKEAGTETVWDRSIRELKDGTTVYSRRTRVPYTISNPNDYVERMHSAGLPATVYDDGYPEPVSGSYDPETQKGTIDLHKGANWRDFNTTLSHEDIHHLLNTLLGNNRVSGLPAPTIRQSLGIGGGSSLYPKGSTDLSALDMWNASQRGGSMFKEIPSYMLTGGEAFKGVRPENAAAYTERFLSQLTEEQKIPFLKVLRSVLATKAGPPLRLENLIPE